MKLKILGTEYEIIRNASIEEYPKLKNCDGYTDQSIKQIVIPEFVKDDMSEEDLEYYTKKVLRHEIVHAFMYESGLDSNSEYAKNEELIDWIAIQFEKMLGVFIEVGAISSIGIDINVFDRTSKNPINDPINPPKVKEVKAFNIPITLPNLSNKELVEQINKTMERVNSGMIGGSG